MVCTGHHWCPKWPDFEGQNTFQGDLIHSHSYKDGDVYTNKEVLIVGIGNSGECLSHFPSFFLPLFSTSPFFKCNPPKASLFLKLFHPLV